MEESATVIEDNGVKDLFDWILVILWSVCVAIFIYFGFRVFKRLWKFCKIRKNLREQWKGPKCHWFWGHLGMVTRGNRDPKRFITYFTEQEKRFDAGFTIYPGPFRAVLMLYDPVIVRQILTATAWQAPKSGSSYRSLVPWLGEGLLVLNNWEWHRHRKLLTSAFHFEILKPYVKIMNNCAKILLEEWKKQTLNGKVYNGEIFKHASLLTLDTILECLMGYKTNCQKESENSYIAAIYQLSELLTTRGRSKNLLMRFSSYYNKTTEGKMFSQACDVVHEISEGLIHSRMNSPGGCEKKYLDFLDIFLQAKDANGSGLTSMEIRAEADTFLFEGHDTTASAITWTLHCLANNPDHQELCFIEVVSVLGDSDDVKWSDLSRFPHLTRCIKESLRLFPPVPLVLRKLNKDIHCGEKTILKGTTVQISIIGVHRNVKYWRDPQTFNPDRFTVESAANQNHHAFIPFSSGPRNCIGQHFAMNEVKVALAQILRMFKLTPDVNREIVHCHEIIYRARGGLYLNVERRQNIKWTNCL